ncbi:hypothetical protein SAMN04487998_2479 [Hymenobacter actinosclerus]|uniref:Uncharacterized protein n=1 Tax=Hymenobacter actinosclerus TaxID=82805 RepID=A0A1I0GP43_9BACT|nr:hypothetical protein SAMN04487998_2479 [Hymenobacter actinosclerus]
MSPLRGFDNLLLLAATDMLPLRGLARCFSEPNRQQKAPSDDSDGAFQFSSTKS